jgi:hypothetical protein
VTAQSTIRHNAVHTSAVVRADPDGDASTAERSRPDSTGAASPASCTTGTYDGSPVTTGRKWA